MIIIIAMRFLHIAAKKFLLKSKQNLYCLENAFPQPALRGDKRGSSDEYFTLSLSPS